MYNLVFKKAIFFLHIKFIVQTRVFYGVCRSDIYKMNEGLKPFSVLDFAKYCGDPDQ
jgi:hypothetical protein